MAQINFCGPSYTSQSTVADAERCLNLYPETIEGNGKGPLALYPTPGLLLLGSLGTNLPIDAMIVGISPVNGSERVFAISGTGFYELNPTVFPGPGLGSILRGTLTSNVFHQPSMTYGQGFIFLAVDGFPYTFNMSTNTFAAATIGGGAEISQVNYCDGFFLAMQYRTNTLYASAPLDPTTWPGTSLTAVSVFPDPLVNMVVNQRQIWLFGTTASVVYYDSGNAPFPFDVIAGSYIEQGSVSSFNQGQFMQQSACKLDNSVFWIGQDPRGAGIVWRANGYTPQRVSNHAVEFAMQGYPTIQDVFLYPYQDQGHSFLVCYFPSANSGNGATWVYDVATNSWHERCFLNGTIEQAHRSKCHAFVSSSGTGVGHLVGDWQNTGSIYQMAIPSSNGSGGWNFVTDFGNPIKRLRRAPVVNIEKEWMRYDELKLDMDVGVGPMPPLTDATITFNDNFNRANGPLGPNWTTIGGFIPAQIVSNQVESTSTTGGTFVVYTGVVFLDQQISMQLVNLANGGLFSLFVRQSGVLGANLTFYSLNIVGALGAGAATGFITYTDTSDVDHILSTIVTLSLNAGDTIGFSVVGSTLTGTVNGVPKVTASDTNILSGQFGFAVDPVVALSDVIVDNFAGQNQPAARDPQVILRWSKDNANTWSNQQFMGAGQAGDYKKQVRMSRMGRARQMTFEVSCTDPVPWRFVNCYLKATAYQPEERLVRKLAKSA